LIVDNLRVVRRVFVDRDADYVKLLASRLSAAGAQTVSLLASNTLELLLWFLRIAKTWNLNAQPID